MNISARIDRLNNDRRKTKAFASIRLDDDFVVRGLAVVEGKNGLFVRMPSRSYTDHRGNPQNTNIVFGLNAESRNAVTKAVLDAYESKLEQQNGRRDVEFSEEEVVELSEEDLPFEPAM